MESEYEILTSEGYKSFDSVICKGKQKTFKITLKDGNSIECTADHMLMLSNQTWSCASELSIGQNLMTKKGEVEIIHIEEQDEQEVYDIVNVEDTNHFYCGKQPEIITHNCLYLDEFAFVEKNMADDFMKSVYPTISSGQETKIIITSTPFGMNHFYKLWTDSIENRNSFKHLEVKWNEVPGRDEKWKEETLKNIGREAFTQEYDIEFIGSAGTLIDPAVLKTLVYREPVYEARDLKIYYQPVKHHTYIMTVDCSEGIGLDYSAASVIDISTIPYQQVAVYRSNTIDPHQLPDIIKELSEKYNDAYTLCELNSTGTIVTSILWNELEFEHLLWCSNAGMKGQVLGSQNGRAQMGLKTSQLSKRIGCSVLKTLIESYQLIINDYSTIQELFAFARDGNTYAAQEGNNDDTVACLFLFGWMTKQTEFQNILESCYRDPDEHNIRNRLHMDALNAVNEMLAPMPIIDDGLEEDYLTRSKRFHAPDPFSFLGL